MKILIVDSYYPQFMKFWTATHRQWDKRSLLEFSFGTADFYSRNLMSLGWVADDYIVYNPHFGHGWNNPDVVFMQNLSLENPFKGALVAGQCSCPWPGDSIIRRYNVIFTSFPHYVPRIEALGVKAVYNPLAFDPIVLERVGDVPKERIHDCVFIGGVGNPSHWKQGLKTLEIVARDIPTFKWWGYGVETLPSYSPLRKCYQGEAWGLDMYRILLQSKIVLNRHGEVTQGYSNNMRMFEATGCGAALLTEASSNLRDFFQHWEVMDYENPEHAVQCVRWGLNNPEALAKMARNGQERTLHYHTYAERMKLVSDTLQKLLAPKELMHHPV